MYVYRLFKKLCFFIYSCSLLENTCLFVPNFFFGWFVCSCKIALLYVALLCLIEHVRQEVLRITGIGGVFGVA